MSDFGQLTELDDDHDIKFKFRGKEWKFNIPAIRVARFKKNFQSMTDEDARDANTMTEMIWQFTSSLFGSKYTPNSEDSLFEGGVLAEIEEAGATFEALDYLITATYFKYYFSEQVAEHYAKSRSAADTIRWVREGGVQADDKGKDSTSAKTRTRKTQKARGATAGTGSDATVTN